MGKNLHRVRPHGVVLRHGLWRHGLSLKALGLLYLLLDLSQLSDWEFSLAGLQALARQHGMGEGRDALRRALAELEAARLLQRQRQRQGSGQLGGSHWWISDEPIEVEPLPAPEAAAPTSENPTLADRLQEGSSSIEEEKNQETSLKVPVSSALEERKSAAEIRGCRPHGTNPRATGTNPRALGTNPRAGGPRHGDFVALWNSQAPEHWVRIRELGQQRQRRLNGLVREFGSPDKALAALEASLRQAHAEEWCMKASARLSLENWLSNGKVRQYQEKAAVAQQATAAALSGEQREIAALAAQHPELIEGVLLEDGVLRLRYSAAVQQQVGYPAVGMVTTVGALAAEIAYLRQQLQPACPF